MADGTRFVKRVGERGVITLPSEVREIMDVKEGDIVEFEVVRIIHKRTPAAPSPSPAPSEARPE